MPVSKKPRARTTAKAPPLPDRRAMEGFLAAIGGRGDDPTTKAQDVMYEAWERTTSRSRIALARKALTISPLCADAYVLLAEEAARSAEEARDFYARGVEAGELALGPEGFAEYDGHFWGFLETRPYMRARVGLALTLLKLGDEDGAMSHFRDMLRLNPNDNQGIRYLLAGCLLRRGEDAALKELLASYEGEGSAFWLYTGALLAFREGGEEDKWAVKLARTLGGRTSTCRRSLPETSHRCPRPRATSPWEDRTRRPITSPNAGRLGTVRSGPSPPCRRSGGRARPPIDPAWRAVSNKLCGDPYFPGTGNRRPRPSGETLPELSARGRVRKVTRPWFSPDAYRPFAKAEASPTAAKSAVALMMPTPGMVAKRRACSSARVSAASSSS